MIGPPARLTARLSVVGAATAMVGVQLLLRAWCAASSWWVGDDFVMIDRVFSPGGNRLPGLLEEYSGHLMPGTLYLTYLITRAAPYEFWLAATVMVGMQAFAGFGFLRLLVVAFGRRWGILPPLLLYLVSPIAVQSTLWWATGSNHYVLHGVFAWATAAQIAYLRNGRVRHAVAAVLWVVLGLVFFEKSLLVIGALGFVTLAYFTEGSLGHRVAQVWQRYRPSVLLNVGLGLAYLALYVPLGLSFSPSESTNTPIGPLLDVMVVRSWATGVLGGPLRWTQEADTPTHFADPPAVVILLSVVVLVLTVRELARTRTASLRSLALPGFFLIANVLLVAAGRASLVGPGIGYEFRYLTELAIVTPAALAFATLPVVGAVEQVTVKQPSAWFDSPRAVVLSCVAVTALATYSTVTYVQLWNSGRSAQARWVATLFDAAREAEPGTPVIDSTAPDYVAWPMVYPANLASHLVRPLDHHLEFVQVGSDSLQVVDAEGRLQPADLTVLQRNRPHDNPVCAYRVGPSDQTIPLLGPAPAETWVRVGYIASGDSAVTVSAGGATYSTSVSRGLHYLFFQAGDEGFDTVRLSGVVAPASLCTNDVAVGLPRPTGDG